MPENYDVFIIGGGPSGYTAGIYASRALLKTGLATGQEPGGQLIYTREVENFPGFEEGILGPKLVMNMRKQASKFGTEIKDTTVTAVDFSVYPFKIWTKLPEGYDYQIYRFNDKEKIHEVANILKQNHEHDIEAHAVIISTGAVARRLNVPGESRFFGKGVSVCAVCDAAFYKDKTAFVIGGGDAALEDALALSKYTDKVTLVHRRDSFRASKIMQERVLNNDRIKIMYNSIVKEIKGDEFVTSVVIETEGQVKEYKTDGVFLAIGHIPVSSLFENDITVGPKGYIVTNMTYSKQGLQMALDNLDEHDLITYPTMTSKPGVFACGDVVDIRYKQAITASCMGAKAAMDAEKWLSDNK